MPTIPKLSNCTIADNVVKEFVTTAQEVENPLFFEAGIRQSEFVMPVSMSTFLPSIFERFVNKDPI